jgi:asparagine synthase (glutamine-hydrolysing)
VQDPVPDLASLLWRLRLPSFYRQLEAWALQRKTTVWALLGRSLVHLAPISMQVRLSRDKSAQIAGWLTSEFVKKQRIPRRKLRVVSRRADWLPGPPVPDSGYLMLAATIAGYLPRFTFAEQSALPYYDRDLVRFLFSIPGEQVLRAQQRRSLMRRALPGIVPTVVLRRNTKALGRRTPSLDIIDNTIILRSLICDTGLDKCYIDRIRLDEQLSLLRQGREVPALLLERLIGTCFLVHQLAYLQLRTTVNSSAATVVAS